MTGNATRALDLSALPDLTLPAVGPGGLSLAQVVQARDPVVAPVSPQLPGVALTPDLLYDALMGEIAASRGQLDPALMHLKRAALASRDPRLLERATQVGIYARQASEVDETARLWAEAVPDSLDAHEARAQSLFDLEDFDGARAEYLRLIGQAKPESRGHAWIRVAGSLGRQGMRGQSLRLMQSLVATAPGEVPAQYALAQLAVRVGDLDVALSAIDQALKSAPDLDEVAIFKSRVLVSRKEPAKAIEYNESWLARHPKSHAVRVNFARLLVDQKQWDRARDEFKRAVEQAPNDADALYAIGLLALQSNLFDEADRYLRQHLEVAPGNDQARFYLGQIAEERGQQAAARAWYEQVTDEASYFEAQARVALTLAREGKLAAARDHLHALQPANDPQQVQIVLAEEQMLREAKDHAEALKVLSRAIEAIPDNTELLYARALVAERLDDIALHERDLRVVLKKDPKNAHALNALGFTLADRTRRYPEALVLIEQALAIKPDDPFILDSMGWVQYRLGHHDEAVKHLRNALVHRSDAEISAHLGEVLWVMGDQSGAQNIWSEARQKSPDSEVLRAVMDRFLRPSAP